jgi:hypothetical protein
MVTKSVWFNADLVQASFAFCRVYKVSFNKLVNEALSNYLGRADTDELELQVKLYLLLKEEKELRQVSSAILRSGAYLPSYAEKVLMTEKGKLSGENSPFTYNKGYDEGRKPLRALSKEEEEAFRKICGRREEIIKEITAIKIQQLKQQKPLRLPNEKNIENDGGAPV